MTVDPDPTKSSVERIYGTVRHMAARFELKPGERINESALAKALGASRTPLREALNRLVAEGFVTFRDGQGFSCRSLTPHEIIDLYEARLALESEIVRLASERAEPEAIEALGRFLDETGPGADGRSIEDLVGLDERFHLGLAELAGNRELVRLLDNNNARIRFVRWIDMEDRRTTTQGEHRKILDAIAQRDGEAASAAIRRHISRRGEEITASVKEGYSRLYVPTVDGPTQAAGGGGR